MVSTFPLFSVYFYLFLKFIFKNSHRGKFTFWCAVLGKQGCQMNVHNHAAITTIKTQSVLSPPKCPCTSPLVINPSQTPNSWNTDLLSVPVNSTFSIIPSKRNPTLLSVVSLAFFTKLSASESQAITRMGTSFYFTAE